MKHTEIKVAEIYDMLEKNNQTFHIEFEKILNKNIILFEQYENSKKCKNIGKYYTSSIFIEDDEIGFCFGDEEHERVYLRKNDIIHIL